MSEDDGNQVIADNGQKRKIREYFSKEEDSQLISLVEHFGPNWHTISEFMEKNSRQCKDRYENYLSPNLNMGPWTKEEDELLISKVAQYGKKWSFIALFFFNRSQVNIKNHYSTLMKRKEKARKILQLQRMKELKLQQNLNLIYALNQSKDQNKNRILTNQKEKIEENGDSLSNFDLSSNNGLLNIHFNEHFNEPFNEQINEVLGEFDDKFF